MRVLDEQSHSAAGPELGINETVMYIKEGIFEQKHA